MIGLLTLPVMLVNSIRVIPGSAGGSKKFDNLPGGYMAPLLRVGSRGHEVIHLQDLLNKNLQLRSCLKVDGIFGPLTLAAVRQYQASVGTTVDGIVGDMTWAALERGVRESDGFDELYRPPLSTNSPWMTIADGEVGETEIKGPEHNPRILQYHSTTSLRATTDEIAWSSAFVNWCLKQVGITGTHSAAASSWLHWGTTSVPRVGAITVMRKVTGQHHVAFFVAETRNTYRLLGGNQGGQVRTSPLSKTLWTPLGYRWPS